MISSNNNHSPFLKSEQMPNQRLHVTQSLSIQNHVVARIEQLILQMRTRPKLTGELSTYSFTHGICRTKTSQLINSKLRTKTFLDSIKTPTHKNQNHEIPIYMNPNPDMRKRTRHDKKKYINLKKKWSTCSLTQFSRSGRISGLQRLTATSCSTVYATCCCCGFGGSLSLPISLSYLQLNSSNEEDEALAKPFGSRPVYTSHFTERFTIVLYFFFFY